MGPKYIFLIWIVTAFIAGLNYVSRYDEREEVQDLSWVVGLGLLLTGPISGGILILRWTLQALVHLLPLVLGFVYWTLKNAPKSIGMALGETMRRS